MSGVEILSSKIIYNTMFPEWCLPVGIILFVCFLFGVYIALFKKLDILCAVCAGIAVFSLGMIICSCTENEYDINYIQYKVTISDEVSMNEFFDKYEIIDQEGKTYTVREVE